MRVGGALLALMVSSGAQAADMYAGGMKDSADMAPPTTWSGFYLGAHVGVADLEASVQDFDGTIFDQEGQSVFASEQTAIGGVLGGFGWQFGSAYFGVEADYTHIDVAQGGFFDGDDQYHSAEWNGIVTARGRLGLAHDNALVYVTGGYAWADLEQIAGDDFEDPVEEQTQVVRYEEAHGFVVGGGAEIMLTPALALRGEYLYVALETETQNCGDDCDDGDQVADGEAHIARIGLSYRFGGMGHGHGLK